MYEGYLEPFPSPIDPVDPGTPTPSIDSPVQGETVSGSVVISVSTPDGIGIKEMAMYIDGTLFATDTIYPYSFEWDTIQTNNGPHTLEAVAYEMTGSEGSSGQVNVNVENLAPDVTPPALSIVAPSDGATVSKLAKVKVRATDDQGVQRIDLYYNDGQLKLIRSSSVSGTDVTIDIQWNTSKLPKGSVALLAVAYDAEGNIGMSEEIRVNLK